MRLHLGQFTDNEGVVRICRVLPFDRRYEEEKDILKIEYIKDGKVVSGFIAKEEFREDK